MPKKRTKYGKKNDDVVIISNQSNMPRCFVCDDRVRGKGVQLVLGRTPYSNTGLPAKISQLIGEDFMVVVCVSDLVCARCTALITQLDKLENDMHFIRRTLTGYLATKYNLNCEDNATKNKSSVPEVAAGSMQDDPVSKRPRMSNKTQSDPSSLLLPVKSKSKQYGCENCSFTTTDADALLPHYSLCARLVHRCSLCQARFETSSRLAQHKRQSHATNWVCDKCTISFNNEQDFSNHMKVHSNKASDKCNVCDFTSTDKTILENHRYSHGVQMYHCPVCQISFEQKGNLENHMACHCELFKCPNCPAAFTEKTNLVTHQHTSCKGARSLKEGIHVESGPSHAITLENLIKDNSDQSTDSIEFYSCQICALTFLNKALFTEHMKMHQHNPDKNALEISDAHAEVLKSATASVPGVCHIDDDLEDLFEKLHAETSNSSLMTQSEVQKTAQNVDNSEIKEDSGDAAQMNGELVLQDHRTLHGISNAGGGDFQNLGSAIQEGTDSHADPLSLLGQSSQDVNTAILCQTKFDSDSMDSSNADNMNMVDMNSNDKEDSNSLRVTLINQENRNTAIEIPAINSTEPDNRDETVGSMNVVDPGLSGDITSVQDDSSDGIVSMAVMDENQQTLIYISGGDSFTGDGQQGMVLHNATIDPSSGNIQLLQYVLDDSETPPDSGGGEQETVLKSDKDFQIQEDEQNFCKMKPEPGLAENNLDVGPGMGDDAFMCAQCGFQTSLITVLKRHLKAHQDNQVQQCSICNRVFSSTQRLLSHLDTHSDSDGPVNCPFCFDEMENCSLLQIHLQDKHPEEKQSFRCRFCDRKFSTKRSCASHEESHTDVFVFPCNNCGKKFPSDEELDDHTSKYHRTNSQCRYCSKEIDNPKALRSHEQRHFQESNHHECSVCNRVFKTKTGLRHHGAVHTGEFKYCCDFCGRGFMSRMMLEEHRSRHTKEERYICDVCGRKFTFQSTYWIHRKWHDNPYPYKCNFCGRMFRHTSLLAVHKRKHTGERPYKCPHCPMTFPVGGTLKRHLILHTGVYPFNCESCSRGFTTKHKYATHLAKVHGDCELINRKPQVKDFKMVVHEPIKDSALDPVESWELIDELALGHIEENSPSVITGDDSLPSDNMVPTRVVEIVMDDSYQAVATVTLAEVSEGGEHIIPDMWYE